MIHSAFVPLLFGLSISFTPTNNIGKLLITTWVLLTPKTLPINLKRVILCLKQAAKGERMLVLMSELTYARRIEERDIRPDILLMLAPYLSEYQLGEVLTAACAIENEPTRA